MPTNEKILAEVMSGTKDKSIRFSELQKLVRGLGFTHCRVKGDHFIYASDEIPELINLQPSGSKAKEYQVKQVRHIVSDYKLELKED